MCSSQDAVVRVGVRAFLAAAAAGLLVLAFQGAAYAESAEELADALLELESDPITPLEQAEEVLSQDRRSRWMTLHEEVVETGFRVVGSSSPRRVLSGVRDVASHLWNINDRTGAEDEALDWLELEVGKRGSADSEAASLYADLRQREIEAIVGERLERAESSLEAGHRLLASAQLQHAATLAAELDDADDLMERIASLGERASLIEPQAAAESVVPQPTEAWEIPLAAALLREDYGFVRQSAPDSPSGRFAFGVATYLEGEPDKAIETFEELSDGDGFLGTLARSWVEREDVNLSGTFEREARSYRIRHVLGLVGGSGLADDGMAMSSDMVRAWRDSITPVNFALSMPARWYRGWRPDGSALREAALQYIARVPTGERADEARAWLLEVPADISAEDAIPVPGRPEGGLFLPPPKTTFVPLSADPLLVTRSVLDSLFVSDAGQLREALGDAHAIVLEARYDVDHEEGLSPERASQFFGELAFALEQGELDSRGPGRNATLDGIRRLENALHGGAVITVEPAAFDSTEIWGTLTRAYIDGEYETVGALTLSRGKDELRAERHFGEDVTDCPEATFCVDRTVPIRTTLYSRIDPDSRIQLALAAEFEGAHMSVSMIGSSGPHATVVLPIGRWLGIGSWLPVAAYVGIGADSVYVGPTFAR